MKNSQGVSLTIVLIIIIIFLSAGVGGAVYYSKVVNSPTQPTPSLGESSVQTEQVENISEWRLYESDFGFSFEYPSDWKVEFDNLDLPPTTMGFAVYNPDLAGSGMIDGEDAGIGLEVWAKKAGFSVTMSSRENFRNTLVSRVTENFESFVEDQNIEGTLEEIIVSGYPASKYLVTKPESASTIQAVWRDDEYGYMINTDNYKDKASLLIEHKAVLDHILDTFR